MTNAEISDVFSLLAKLMDIHNENSFRAKSYASAAFTIDKLSVSLAETPKEQIQYIKGIGESNAKKIIEIVETGKLEQLNELLAKTPEGILALLKIKGIGPKKIAVIWNELGIESPGELLYACNENRLIHYKGFGDKSQQSIKEALLFYFSNQQRYLYAQVEPVEILITAQLQLVLGQHNIELVGSYARQCDIIEELEYVILGSFDFVKSSILKIKGMQLKEEATGRLQLLYQEALPVFLYIVDENIRGSMTFIKSCSPAFLHLFEKTYDINLSVDNFKSELDIFNKAGIKPMPFFTREAEENIALWTNSKHQSVITVNDIKGVIHNHSVWSDGKNTIAEMAQACIDKGYEYLVMSDHSVSSFYANGLDALRIQKQQEEIDQLNEKLFPFKIFKSIECDILNDGRLDYSDEILATFDLVIVSIHQHLKMTEEKAMERLLAAISNPYTTILGHLTGRLLLSRKEYPVNHEMIIQACKEHQVAIEINANPRRLDVDWRWIQAAIQQEVFLSINPDAHSIQGIDDIRYGVLCAQKALLTPQYNVSSMSLLDFEKFIKKNK
ncbi:MAG: DNA polymerase/3'-5' exonuclease PolX [Bacteroidetes bacterium]|nr:DNA polymerase/3'-5' exonuclease PolX [Bacteroidota bacterium]MBK7589696.1 DNA polymerase/3'-5' exonuclease PolX [Bacteroidota bacterium]